jgi:predicted ATP-grasp superfamily ATP-dependent carboligase
LAEGSGVELLYTMYCDLAGLPLPVQREQAYRGTKWVFLRRDMMSGFHYWRKGEISLVDWFRSLRGRKVYALFSWTDPVPFLADLVRAAFLVLFRNERRKRARDSRSLKQ